MNERYGLIFDVDGVIADTEGVNAVVTARVLEELFGITQVKEEDFVLGIGCGDEEYVRAGARAHGLELTDKQAKAGTQLREKYFIEAMATEPLKVFDGVIELMDDALESGRFSLAIATSGSFEKSRAIVQSAGAPYEQMAHVSGNDVKRRKPDPEIFLLACGRIGIDAGLCAVVEDAPDGVAAAKAAGTACIAVTNSASAEKLSGADLVCDSLADISIGTVMDLIRSQEG
ncbi:MAG: HAD family phosphatase [Sedimentisphaerales bacterium]|nr:HAD family phosphatase [Sedimentisphaerales bacterium]